MANTRRLSRGLREKYNQTADLIAASGAISQTAEVTGLTVSGTKAYTLPAPTFSRQRKVIYTDSAASTPVATVAVASCKGAAATVATRTFSGFGTIGTTAPKTLELYAPTGEYWVIVGMVGVTVA